MHDEESRGERNNVGATSENSATSTQAESWISERYRGLPYDSDQLGEVRATLDSRGIAEFPGFLTPEAHSTLRDQILILESGASRSEDGRNRKFAIKGAQLNSTVVGELSQSKFLLDLVNNLLGSQHGTPLIDRPIRPDEVVPGVAVMRGPGDVTAYHFDGSFLNLIFPVIIPTIQGPRRGQLVIYPNTRSFKQTTWNTKIIPALARVPRLRRFWKKLEIDYREDTVYAFYGYRSLHGVESPSQAALRCITNMAAGRVRPAS
jgi:hypothetical protein